MSGVIPPLTHMLSWQDFHLPLPFGVLILFFAQCFGKDSVGEMQNYGDQLYCTDWVCFCVC